jgi:BlaI family penicillinase repressor
VPETPKSTVLTPLELEVMRALWQSPKGATVRDAVQRLNAGREKPHAYTTVQTILTILKDKGAVDVTPGPGRAHLFHPRISAELVTTSMVGEFVDRLFGGQARPLLQHLVEKEELSADELRELRRWIDHRLDDKDPTP